MKKILAIAVIVLGIVSSILFFIAGSQLGESGENLTKLRSVGGTSVAEAYYQEVGQSGIAYSFFAYALGVGILSISVGIGCFLLHARGGGPLLAGKLNARGDEPSYAVLTPPIKTNKE